MEESPVVASQKDPISSPVGIFSHCSSQSSEEGMKGTKMIPYVPPLKKNGEYSLRIPYQRWTREAST